tara:strand:+ start:1513 stop:2202 length:690 start_codon:yes stop_codon:yes gene_type:complete
MGQKNSLAMGFEKQAQTMREFTNAEGEHTYSDTGRDNFLKNSNPDHKKNAKYWSDFMTDSNIGQAVEMSYSSPDGYAIRVNPVTGLREMFIAGTSSASEWVQNLAEGVGKILWNPHSMGSEMARDTFAAKLEGIADDEHVDVVYGHSRGASIMSGMTNPDRIYIGLDGASAIGHKKHYINLIQGGITNVFDKGISFGHKGNVKIKGTGFHSVWDKKSHRKKKYKKRKFG